MKKDLRKLALHRETLSQLDAGEMQCAAGGKGPTAIDCSVTCLVVNTDTTTRLCA